MSKTKFVYFDIGGVMLRDFTNTNKWAEMKKDLGVNKENEEIFDSIWQRHRSRICIDCDIDTIIPEFEKEAGIVFPKDYSMLEDFVDRFDPSPSIWLVIDKVKDNYKIGLLTNTYPLMLDMIRAKNKFPKYDWEVIVDSSLVGFQKPESEIYEIAEERSGLKPEELFFIDNLSKNTNAAKKRGWKVFHYDDQNPEKASKELISILNLD